MGFNSAFKGLKNVIKFYMCQSMVSFSGVIWRKTCQFMYGEIISVCNSIRDTLTGCAASAKFFKVTPGGR